MRADRIALAAMALVPLATAAFADDVAGVLGTGDLGLVIERAAGRV